jgi:UBX domain
LCEQVNPSSASTVRRNSSGGRREYSPSARTATRDVTGTTTATNSSSGAGRSSSSSNSSVRASLSQRIQEVLAFVAALLWRPIYALYRALFPPSDFDGLSPAVCCKAALDFATHVLSNSNDSSNSSSNPTASPTSQNHSSTAAAAASAGWLTSGFSTAKQEAVDSQSLLLVVLHSPLHPKSKPYLNRLSKAVGNLLRTEAHIRAVGYSIQTAQGLYLSQVFSVASYPFVALVQPPVTGKITSSGSENSSNSNSPTRLNLLVRAEGPALVEYNVDHLVAIMQACLTRHQVQVAEALARRLQQEEESQLRRMQDEEYQMSLAADQQREREERQKQQMALHAEQEKLNRHQQAQRLLQENDDAVASGAKTANVRFVLPSGGKLNHKFDETGTCAVLFAYLKVHFHEHNIPIETIGLSTSFPKRSLDEDDSQTLVEAQISPQAVLMVQDLDA